MRDGVEDRGITWFRAEVERRWGRSLLKAGTDLRRSDLNDHAENFNRGFWSFNASCGGVTYPSSWAAFWDGCVASYQKAKGTEDQLKVVTFAEHPSLVEFEPGKSNEVPPLKALRHRDADGKSHGSRTDIRAAVALAGIEGQWKGQPPWTSYRALRDGPGMVALGTRGRYTLLAVRQSQP